MKNSEKQLFGQIISGVYQVYEKNVNDFMMAAFWVILKSYELGAVQRAFMHYLSVPACAKYIPKPIDIKQILDASNREKAGWAWDKICSAMRCADQDPIFDDPITYKIICEMGGWGRFLNVSDLERPYVGDEFKRIYRDYISLEMKHLTKPLASIRLASEQTNDSKQMSEPKLIEEMKICNQVMTGLADSVAMINPSKIRKRNEI